MNRPTPPIECEDCGRTLTIAMPWRCGHCGFDNHRTELYSFLFKCQKCEWKPTAVICPHCDGLIFLTEDNDRRFPVCSIPQAKKQPEPMEDQTTRERREHAQEKERLERAIEKAELEAKLDQIKNPATAGREKSIEDALAEELEVALKEGMALENAVAKVKRRVAEQFKDDLDNLEKNNLWIEQWRERRIPT